MMLILNTPAAFTGAFSYAHFVFLLVDPPDWSCSDQNVIKCNVNSTGKKFPSYQRTLRNYIVKD